MATEIPRHSSNVEGATHSQGLNSMSLQNIHYFSKHDTIKLGEHNFLLWKHQILLILESYDLEGFVLGTAPVPSTHLPGPDRHMRHALYSFKKRSLTVKEYLNKVKSLSDSINAAGSMVREQEQVSIVLAGLSLKYESIRVLASATPMSLELLTEMLLDCET
ncbi:hypothetical protein PVK06_012151 [Gossypium arboreum]|uniref:Retrovirus-related Pol polyprotein from transposon TNT 1-94 n=1 Tax=Gossypium arboreum TaxID=29729 RepID=A0ABR0QAL5_GOSAR|nr:hypothetical protein PVK06_012151 [Gossypium arboreum]